MPAGHPKIFSTVEEVIPLMERYFSQFEDEKGEKAKKAPNLFGLCRSMKISYDAFLDYECGNNGEELSIPFKECRLRCLEYAGEHVYTHTAGSVFTHVNLTKKYKEPWKNAQTNELHGPKEGPIDLKMTVEYVKADAANPDTGSV